MQRNSIVIYGFLLLLCSTIACKKKAPTSPQDHTDATNQAISLGVKSSASADESCLQDVNNICESGLLFVQLGNPISEWDTTAAKQKQELLDELISMGGYSWISRTVKLKGGGQIIVEGDFVADTQINDTTMSQTAVSRIRIESPHYTTYQGIRVGDPFQQLKTVFQGKEMIIESLPNYQVLDIRIPTETHFSFLIQDPENKIARSVKGGMLLPEDVNDKLAIDAIVVK